MNGKLKTWLIRLIPIVFILLSIGVMTTGNLLKQPFAKDDHLVESIKTLESNVQNKNWDAAEDNIEYAKKAWNKIVNRIQLSVEREYVIDINGTLDRMKGGIKAKDNQAIMEEIYYFYGLWKYLAR